MSSTSAYRLRRTADEIYLRSLDGAAFYALGCLLIAGAGSQPWAAYTLHGLAALAFLVLWALRHRHRVPADDARLAAWLQRHFLLIHAGSLLWSLVLWRTLVLDGAHSTALVVGLLCTAGFGVAIAMLYAASRRQTLVSSTLLVAPFLVVTALQPEARDLTAPLIVLLAYLVVASRRAEQRFQAQLDLEQALEASRAEVERLTLQDGLTLLANRRAYDLQVPQSWDQAHRRRAPLSLIMVDIDHFKQVNDTHGHAAGDACLRHVAVQLRQHFRRAGDLAVRLGGEEFVVLLADCTLHDAAELAEAFRLRLAASPAQHEGQSLAITASFGVAQAHWDGHDHPDKLLERADAALYRAKHGGRNRVEPELRE